MQLTEKEIAGDYVSVFAQICANTRAENKKYALHCFSSCRYRSFCLCFRERTGPCATDGLEHMEQICL